jgi:D-3-phosphoglycerate dehydrogenase / 2-oxoglutarate reductase
MGKFKVVVTDYVFPNFNPEQEIFAPLGAELVAGQSKCPEDLLKLVPGAHAMLNTYYGPIDAQIMDAMPECKAIIRYGIGVDTIDIPAATQRGIMVANVPDYCIDEVSDHAVGMLLALLRKLPQGDRDIRAGTYSLAPLKPMTRINATTIGIVGFGRIGQAIAKKLVAFGPKIVFFDPYYKGNDFPTLESVSLDQLYQVADGIILQAPATPKTKNMLDNAAFAKMARKPVIVNCARGELIDNDALITALKNGAISGAALDVVTGTPPAENFGALLDFNNVLVTPHSAWFSAEALTSLQRLAAMEVARVLQGERPKSLLNPEVLQ